MKNIIIFGAQGYALSVYNAIKTIYPTRRVLFFMVTKIGSNSTLLAQLPVREIESVSIEFSFDEKRNIEVLIATPENVHSEIEDTLDKYGFTNHSKISSEYWDDLMNQLHSKTELFSPLKNLPAGNSNPALTIYMAKSHNDKPLVNPYTLPRYYLPIQVGASNTNNIISNIRDDIGENISAKNGNYCELTGLYWIWKNVLCDNHNTITKENPYFGFAQYRRVLLLSDDDLLRLEKNDIDVVLPYPLFYEPNINAHHNRYLKDSDWSAMLKALKDIHPKYEEAFSEILNQGYLYNYNVVLAKQNVLKNYCEWLFPILERTEELSIPKGSDRSDRYIGYMGESLETLYFMYNKSNYKIAHVGCKLFI